MEDLKVVMLLVVLVAAIAPLVMSLSARSAVSTVVSVVLLAVAGFFSRDGNVFGLGVAAVFYLGALLSASVITAGYRIEKRIESLHKDLMAKEAKAGEPND